ncbi:MAG TPA: hypothetical protein VNZ03_08945 [Terriglobales bacterium]|jgi:hypothetical protein|nr:hypothetical protein [Terriglobales bacterium]
MSKVLPMRVAVAAALLMILPVVAVARKQKIKKEGEDTIYGTVTCTVPPPPYAPGTPVPPPDSVKQCLDRKGLVVIAPDGNKNGVTIDNPDVVRGYEGHHVSVSGYSKGETFYIVSVRVL